MKVKKTSYAKAGRPRIEEGTDTVPVTLRMTPSQREKLAKLGGPPWVRERIEKAKLPKE